MFGRFWDGIYRFATRDIDDEARARQIIGFLEAWVSIIGNVLLFGVKFALGVAIGSISLMADAFHTLSDVLTSVVVLIGFKAAGRAPDEEHPFGHGRIENIATLVIAILLVVVGVDFLAQSARKLIRPMPVAGTIPIAAILLLSGAVKELMASFSIWLGRRIDSKALVADAWHHRSDAVASVLVALAIVGALFRLYWLDGLFGAGVSLLIIYTGFDVGRSAANPLLGLSPGAGVLASIQDEASTVEGVIGVHDVSVHDYGQRRAISLYVEVPAGLDLHRAHSIADEVERRIAAKMNADTVVHVDPQADREG
ncbi:MAG: cation diffusion facilitator family transporter [Firmicutes bacterium]|nr:cation diffusion facilitator family transporter [Bacillota bacterium]